MFIIKVNGFWKQDALEVFDTLRTDDGFGIRVKREPDGWKAFEAKHDMKQFRKELDANGIQYDFRAV